MTEPTDYTNISQLFENDEYKMTLLKIKELVRVSDIVNVPLVILDYKEDTMADKYKKDAMKPCFRMDFHFADDKDKIRHYIRTEARYLWDYLRAVNMVNRELLTSGTLVAVIFKGEKKSGGMKTPFYYFAGTMDDVDETN